MAVPSRSPLAKRGLLAALVTAAGVLALVLAQQFLTGVLSLGIAVQFGSGGLEYAASVLQGVWIAALTTALPMAVGVFVSLWLLAPIGAVLRLGHVIARGLLATAAGAALTLVVGFVVLVGRAVGALRPWFGSSFDSNGSLREFGPGLLSAVTQALTTAVQLAPLVTLAVVLLWTWTRSTDRDHDVHGYVDR